MTGEIESRERGVISFDELGVAMDEYEAAAEPYWDSLFINLVYYDESTSNLRGQDLADWKGRFPNVDDNTLARQEEEYRRAQDRLVEILGLESVEVIPDLKHAFQEEYRRQRNDEAGHGPEGWWKGLVVVEGPFVHPPEAFVRGIIVMARLTGQSYTAHAGRNIGYTEIGASDSVEEALAKLQELGLELPAAQSEDSR
jgi:hypothetical protein